MNEAEEILLIELFLEYAIDQNIELAIIQNSHIQGFIDLYGGFYVALKY